MKYIAVFDDEFLEGFRRDDDGLTLVLDGQNKCCTRAVRLKPLNDTDVCVSVNRNSGEVTVSDLEASMRGDKMKIIIDIDSNTFNRICDTKSIPDILGIDIVNGLNSIKYGVSYEDMSKGKWLREGKTTFSCSECGREIDTKPFTRPDNFPYCHCGAKMEGPDVYEANN